MGRFVGVDPLASDMPSWSPYHYVHNNPLRYTDPTGLFESRDSAANYADQSGIKVGLFRRNKIVGNSDGSYSIVNRKEHSSITDFGDDIGVQEGVVVSPYDVISVEKEGNLFFGYSETGTRRDGSEVELTPLSGTAPGPGKFLKTAKGLKVLGEAGKGSTKGIKSLGAAARGFSKVKIPKGFKHVKDFGYQHGQKVYKYKGKYYSKDIDGHNGGAWKVFENVGGRLKRIGTADGNLNIFKN